MRLDPTALSRMLLRRQVAELTFRAAAMAALLVALGSLAALLLDAFFDGAGRLSWQFLSSFPSRHPEEAGILAALVGSVAMIVLTAAFALPIGVGAAVYLEEYAGKTWWARVIEVNIANLAGVPSIVYGLLGLELFVRALKLDRSLLAGALTMALLVMPIIIISSREALRTVPNSIREASCALGATRWQTIWYQVLPMAFPGILTGSILAFSRAIGEAAPLITIGALTYVAFLPDGLLSPFTALPIQIFNWVSQPETSYQHVAAAGIIVLLVVLLVLNSAAIVIRNRFQKRMKW